MKPVGCQAPSSLSTLSVLHPPPLFCSQQIQNPAPKLFQGQWVPQILALVVLIYTQEETGKQITALLYSKRLQREIIKGCMGSKGARRNEKWKGRNKGGSRRIRTYFCLLAFSCLAFIHALIKSILVFLWKGSSNKKALKMRTVNGSVLGLLHPEGLKKKTMCLRTCQPNLRTQLLPLLYWVQNVKFVWL